MLADFEREATLLSEFDHPNIGNSHSNLYALASFPYPDPDSFGSMGPDPSPDPAN